MLQYGNKFAPPQKKIFYAFSNEVHVMSHECLEIFDGYYILRPNLTLASISFLVYYVYKV